MHCNKQDSCIHIFSVPMIPTDSIWVKSIHLCLLLFSNIFSDKIIQIFVVCVCMSDVIIHFNSRRYWDISRNIVACRLVAGRQRDKQIYDSRYWVTASKTDMFPSQQLSYNNEEGYFLCAPCWNVISGISWELQLVSQWSGVSWWLVGELLGFNRCERLLLEPGSWGRG
jgi:hypothetical protein